MAIKTNFFFILGGARGETPTSATASVGKRTSACLPAVLVPREGLEPSPLSDTVLNRARLPIPPPRQGRRVYHSSTLAYDHYS